MKNIKQILIIILIVIIIIVLDIIIENNTKNLVSDMNSRLEEIDNLIAKDEYTESKVEDLVNEWNNQEKIISCYLEHDEIEKIGDKISLLQKQMEIEDYDDARQNIAETKFLFEHIESKQSLNIQNFF